MKNQVSLIGRIGQKPELRTVGETNLVTFSLATSRKFKDRSGHLQEETQWHSCEIWGKRAKVIYDYTDKGHLISVDGELRYDQWEDKQGQKRTTAKVRVGDFTLLPNPGGQIKENGNTYAQPVKQTLPSEPIPQSVLEGSDDDLPF